MTKSLLWSRFVTNAAGHITTFNEYDKNGRLTKMTDPNGWITTMTYHPRGWLTSRAVANGSTTETTTYTYDNVGQLTSVVTPDGVPLNYVYDAAHRLVRIWDESLYVSASGRLGNGALGNHIDYTLDNLGNRIKEEHFDANGKYILTSVHHVANAGNVYRSGDNGTLSYSNTFTCIPDALPFRPQRTTSSFGASG